MRTRIGQKMAKVAAIGFSLEKPKENKIYFVFEVVFVNLGHGGKFILISKSSMIFEP